MIWCECFQVASMDGTLWELIQAPRLALLEVLLVAMLPGTTFPATVKHARHIEGAGGEKHTETRCAASSLKGSLSHDVFLFSWEMRANACVRKKRNSTPELWRPCHLRFGYGDEPVTRVKNPQASKRHRKHEKTLFLEWLLGRFRAKNGGSEKPAKRRTFPIFAGTHRFSWSKQQDWRFCSGTWNHLKLYFVCSQPVPLAVVAGQSKIFRTCPNVRC